MSARRQSGFTLIELLTTISIFGLIAACALPAFVSMRRRAAVREAAAEIRAVMQLVRSRAITRRCNSAVKFTQFRAEWQYALYDDGDGDGVRNDDIARSIDRRVAPPRFLWQQPQLVSIALPSYPLLDPDGDPIAADASAVQFNRSTLCSFSPLGQATSGTIYLVDSAGESYAVRVYGATAKVRVLRYNRGRRAWESR